MRTALLLALMLALLPAFAFGQRTDYLGFGVGTSNLDIADFDDPGVTSRPVEKTDSAYKLVWGFELIDHFAAELGVVDLGSAGNIDIGLSARTFFVAGVGRVGTEQFSALARAGIHQWRSRLSTGSNAAKGSGVDLTYGAGVEVRVRQYLLIRIEYDVYRGVGKGTLLQDAGGDVSLKGGEVSVAAFSFLYRY